MAHTSPRRAVATIVLAMLLGTSVWFSANSAADGLRVEWGLDAVGIGRLTLAVQLGFALGTILMVTREMERELGEASQFADDVRLLLVHVGSGDARGLGRLRRRSGST